MKKILKNIDEIMQYEDCIELEGEKFYGITQKINLGDDVEIEYEKSFLPSQDLTLNPSPDIPQGTRGEDEQEKQEEVQTEKINLVKNIKITKSKEQVEKEKKQQIREINRIFDEKINEYLADYPNYEIQTFEAQRLEVEKFRETGKSAYLQDLMNMKNIVRKKAGKKLYTLESLATVIEQNAQTFKKAYHQLMVWKDSEIEKIKNNT